MKLSTPRYTVCLILQIIFILCDLIFNCVSIFPRSRDGLLVLFIFQDFFLVLSITTLLMSVFSTYLFQAGLVEVLFRKFRVCVVAACAYVCASVCVHAAILLLRDSHTHTAHTHTHTPAPLVALFVFHRTLSPWYYVCMKRAALRVADPRLHIDYTCHR